MLLVSGDQMLPYKCEAIIKHPPLGCHSHSCGRIYLRRPSSSTAQSSHPSCGCTCRYSNSVHRHPSILLSRLLISPQPDTFPVHPWPKLLGLNVDPTILPRILHQASHSLATLIWHDGSLQSSSSSPTTSRGSLLLPRQRSCSDSPTPPLLSILEVTMA